MTNLLLLKVTFMTAPHNTRQQPGNGRGYVRHMDYSKDRNANSRGRKLTAILYLNEEWEGGLLRVHLPSDALVPTAISSLGGITSGGNTHDQRESNSDIRAASHRHIDIDPSMGRLVIFRRLD